MKELIEFLEKKKLKGKADSLKEGCTRLDLSSVWFIGNKKAIGDVGASSLAASLKDNKSLTSLELSSNKIGDAGASSLAANLKDNYSLISLDLFYNNIDKATLNTIDGYLQRNLYMTAEQKAENLNAVGNDLCHQEKYSEAIEINYKDLYKKI